MSFVHMTSNSYKFVSNFFVDGLKKTCAINNFDLSDQVSLNAFSIVMITEKSKIITNYYLFLTRNSCIISTD